MSEKQSTRQGFANRLRAAREFAGLSQAQVAKMMELHRPSISEAEAGRRKISTDELARLAEIYDVDIRWLAGNWSKTDDHLVTRVELAARELSKLKSEDLDLLIELLSTLRTSEES